METIGGDLRQMQRIPLAAAHVEALRSAGTIATPVPTSNTAMVGAQMLFEIFSLMVLGKKFKRRG